MQFVCYLSNTVGPVSLVLDLCITHERWESSSNPSLNGHLHYPTDIDGTLNEVITSSLLVQILSLPSLSFVLLLESISVDHLGNSPVYDLYEL